MYPALPAEYSANIPPESCPDRRRRRAAPELQTKPAVHCTDPAAPGALPRHLPKLNRSFLAARFDSNTAANENRGSVWSRCSVCWKVGLLHAFRRERLASKGKSMCTVNAASVEPAGREEVSGVARLKPWSARAWLRRESKLLERASERCSDRPRQEQYDGKWTTWLYSSAKQRGRPTARQRPAVNPACFVGRVRGIRVRELARFTSHIDREPPLSNKTSVKQSQLMSLR